MAPRLYPTLIPGEPAPPEGVPVREKIDYSKPLRIRLGRHRVERILARNLMGGKEERIVVTVLKNRVEEIVVVAPHQLENVRA